MRSGGGGGGEEKEVPGGAGPAAQGGCAAWPVPLPGFPRPSALPLRSCTSEGELGSSFQGLASLAPEETLLMPSQRLTPPPLSSATPGRGCRVRWVRAPRPVCCHFPGLRQTDREKRMEAGVPRTRLGGAVVSISGGKSV